MDGPITTAGENFKPLTDEEIEAFFNDLDKNNNGLVEFAEIEARLHEIFDELMPEPEEHHLHHPSRKDRDLEKHAGHKGDGLHAFICSIMPNCDAQINKADFTERVKRWQVPSQTQTDSKEQDAEDSRTEHKLPFRRRARAYFAVHGPPLMFLAFVIALQLAFGLWQMIIYIQNRRARSALGWGIIMAKAAAGALYPTLFFMLLSMSRHFSTFLRRSYIISRFINWDLSQAFHIKMSIAGLVLATFHAIGHLFGDFWYSTKPAQQPAVAVLLGPQVVPLRYVDWVRTLPGWSGIVAFGIFWTIALLSMPFVRKRSYEIFQLGHLLMFPMIGLLCAHGTAAILQAPMLGYWLAFPSLLVVFERSWRLLRGFYGIPAIATVLDNDAITLTCKHPHGKDWKYSAGQYILLQVPKVSFFQWHPFTISACRGNIMQVHIKFDGDWTNSLRDKLPEGEEIKVGIDGPFGAPAQRFYDYDYSIIVGGGIGVTPFSAILTDLEENFSNEKDRRNPWDQRRRSRSLSRPRLSLPGSGTSSRLNSKPASDNTLTHSDEEIGRPNAKNEAEVSKFSNPNRRVDFHWTVREKGNLLWFSELLNTAIEGAKPLARRGELELNINTHITAKRKNISTHVFRYLLDSYRTEASPYSALTGLKAPSHFGRPDFDAILNKHFDELVEAGVTDKKVGVFYCGAPVVGEILSDRCHVLTSRARDMGLKLRYDFLIEVFG